MENSTIFFWTLPLAKCHQKVQNFFPKKLKTHEMDTRNTEKYHVNHAHTERLRKSAVIYMQKLLNKHEKSWKLIWENSKYQFLLALQIGEFLCVLRVYSPFRWIHTISLRNKFYSILFYNHARSIAFPGLNFSKPMQNATKTPIDNLDFQKSVAENFSIKSL